MDKKGFERLVQGFGRALEKRNAEAASTYFSQYAIYSDAPGVRSLMGREAIRQHFEEIAKGEGNPTFVLHKAVFSGDEGAVEWTFEYRSASTGKHEIYRCLALVELEGDTFSSWREYRQHIQPGEAQAGAI